MTYPNRRQHVGSRATPREDPPPPPPTIQEVGQPPQPLPPHVAIVNSDGTPTVDFFQWTMKVHDWRMKLWTHLGGSLEPPPEAP